MFIPYFNTKDNYIKYNRDIKIANGYCLNCNKPLNNRVVYCSGCTKKLLTKGLEDKRVKLGEVGRNTINYQQYLHRSFFDCNVHIDYRGEKNDRIKARVSKSKLKSASIKLDKMLLAKDFRYNGKTYKRNDYNIDMYKSIMHVRNIKERLIYNILLYYISYHIENNHSFKTFVHFQTSMIQNLLINIENTSVRVNKANVKFSNQKRNRNNSKFYYWFFTEIDKIIKPLMNEVIESIN